VSANGDPYESKNTSAELTFYTEQKYKTQHATISKILLRYSKISQLKSIN
jgi:hypothetical protein